MMGYLSKFGYDEVYFNKILLQNIENDALLKQDDALKKALCELVSQGGKRIRPLFLLMATDLGSYPKKEDCYLAAVAIELLHLSSLIHDDIIDHSPMRHNVLTLHERYGAKIALKLGNYTLNKSLELFSHFDDPRLHLQLAHTMKQLCLGELKQKEDLFNFNLQLEDYIEKSHQKTGTLISVSLVIGGLIAHLSNDELDELSTLGHSIGIAYQLKDDISDFTSLSSSLGKPVGGGLIAHLSNDELDELSTLGHSIGIAYQLKDDISDFTSLSSSLGKPVGNDLRQGIITLPTIFALEDDLIKEELMSLHLNKESSTFDSLCKRINSGHYIQQSEDVCQSYINNTLAIMNKLPNLKPKMSHLIELLFN